MVVSAALGGNKKKTLSVRDPNVKDVTEGASSINQAVHAMNRMLRGG